MSDNSIWGVLSAIDCNKHVEKKGKYSYLAWTWAWATVKEVYPTARYELLDDIVYPDETMEVRVKVDIGNETFDRDGRPSGDYVSHTMWLPVLDYNNKPIANPNAYDINTARMRCLVKCLAMFGLGHYIYAGESTPTEPGITPEEWEAFLAIMADGDPVRMVEFMDGIGENKAAELYNKAPHGQKTEFKKTVDDLRRTFEAMMDDYAGRFKECIEMDDADGILELVGELTEDPFSKARVWARLLPQEQHTVKGVLEASQ